MYNSTSVFNHSNEIMTKKRVRYKIPTYKKTDKINRNIKDYSANQKHIFRYKILQCVYCELAFLVLNGQCRLPVGDMRLFKDGLVIHFETEYGGYTFDYQAEINGTQSLPVGERLRIHIKLLRLLKQGYKLKKAVRLCRIPLK
ncbi:MAG: hypothetical protein KHX03_09725 [Clostridium sp.]|nr:hypothetical protein [Clostridium sp.]